MPYKLKSKVLSAISSVLTPIKKIKNTGKAFVGGTKYQFKLIGSIINAQAPKYDFRKIRQIYRRFGFIRQALSVYKHRATSELPDIVCDNVRARTILMERLDVMNIFDELPNMFQDLTSFGNVFYEIVYDEEEIDQDANKKLSAIGGSFDITGSFDVTISKEKDIKNVARRLKRVIGIKRLEPDYMRIVKDKYGRILYYISVRDSSNYIVMEPWRMIHVKLDALPGDSFGIGLIEGAIDDIAALRMVEDLQLQLIKHDIYPFRMFACPSNDVILEVESKLAEQERFGDLVVPSEVKMSQSTVGNASQDLRALMKHYQENIFMDVGVPMNMLIEGSKTNKACYSSDTETLTQNGWKYYWDVDKNDLIGTYNSINGKLEFEKPIGDIYLYDYNGEMIHFNNRTIDILVTPDHRMYCKEFRREKFGIVKAEEINWGRTAFEHAVDWDGKECGYFTLKQVKYENSFKKKNVGDRNIPMDKWLKLLGYILSEGCVICCPSVKNQYGLHISQRKDYVRDKIKDFMDSITEFKVIEKPHGQDKDALIWYIYDKSLHTYLMENTGNNSHDKRIPLEFRSLPKRQLQILFDALMDGDGSYDKRINRKSMCYYTASRELAGNVQEIAIKLGYNSMIINGTRCFRVLISHRNIVTIGKDKIFREHYKGKVYCFNVPNHLFLTRRNGKVAIQGNTAIVQSDAFNHNVYSFINQLYIPLERFSKLVLLFEGIASDVTWNYKDIDRGAEQSVRKEITEWFKEGMIDREDAINLLDTYGAFRYMNVRQKNRLMRKSKPALNPPEGEGEEGKTVELPPREDEEGSVPELGDRIADITKVEKPSKITDRIKERVIRPDGTSVEKTTERIQQSIEFADELRNQIMGCNFNFHKISRIVVGSISSMPDPSSLNGQLESFCNDIDACLDLYNQDSDFDQYEYLVSKSCATFSRNVIGKFE